jgi:ATP adenylyltransferase
MKRLWSPWRMTYIESSTQETGCIFCNRLEEDDGPGNLILLRGKNTFLILNRYPYTNGHMMVVPYQHANSLELLQDDTLSEMMQYTKLALRLLREEYGARDFNVGINIGEAAGAGVADHVHIHIVPRWAGDTNFMSTTAETRVLPESLEQSYSRIKARLKKINSS